MSRFFYYRDRELEDVAVLASFDGAKAINGAVDALSRLDARMGSGGAEV